MNHLKKYLSQQYPLEENVWKIIIPISLFIGLFMLIFQPFGLDDIQLKFKALKIAGFGLVTFLILIFNLLILRVLFPKFFSENKWTFIKEIFFLLWILFTVGLGNLYYSFWTMGFSLSAGNILIFQAYTIAVGIIPVTVLTMIKLNHLTRKNRESAGIISSSIREHQPYPPMEQEIRICSENERECVVMKVQDLLFIRSDGNYITVGYLRNEKPAKILLRNTMKYVADMLLQFPFLYQCHRSWLVNLHRISGVTGNAQGLKINIKGFEEEIPVARNNIAGFKKQIRNTGE